jgi:hypothetical protein
MHTYIHTYTRVPNWVYLKSKFGIIHEKKYRESVQYKSKELSNHHHWLRSNPEERSSQLIRDGSLKSRIIQMYSEGKGKAIPLQAWTGPEGSKKVEAPRFQDSRHMKVVRLLALHTGRLYHPPPH